MKFKLLLCAVILGTLASGAAFLGGYQVAAQAKKEKAGADATDEELAKLRQAKVKAAEAASRAYFKRWEEQPYILEKIELCYSWSKRLVDVEVEVAPDKNSKIESLTKHLKKMKAMQGKLRRVAARVEELDDQLTAIDYYVIEAEFWLAQIQKDSK